MSEDHKQPKRALVRYNPSSRSWTWDGAGQGARLPWLTSRRSHEKEVKNSLEDDSQSAQRSLLELEGLGAELWRERDAQAYVHELRAEWDEQA